MEKKAVISIRTVHAGEDEPMSFVTDGVYTFDAGESSVSYLESAVTGMEGTKTTIRFRGQEMILDREGSVTGRMLFRDGVTNQFNYGTPYGSAVMALDTKEIRMSFGPDGGSAEIDYVLGMQHRVFTRCRMYIRVDQQGEEKNV